ncbi:MAG TPA: methyltransferase type 11, partial [Coriobacteriia bacterium]|nr:methyltransferase type 11 [Coriobacteriia bacterium]
RLAGQLEADFALESEDVVEAPLTLTHEDLEHVALMGPSAWHVESDALAARIAVLPRPFATAASVRIATYRPR